MMTNDHIINVGYDVPFESLKFMRFQGQTTTEGVVVGELMGEFCLEGVESHFDPSK